MSASAERLQAALSTDQLVVLRAQQALFNAASRHLGQIAGLVLLALTDAGDGRLTQHLPAIRASHDRLIAQLNDAISPADTDRLLHDVRQRLGRMIDLLQGHGLVEALSERDVSGMLNELHDLRRILMGAGRQSCQFTMVHFAAGCCCGQHNGARDGEAARS
jgi:hypothetical protein